jgi:hypothetical protein
MPEGRSLDENISTFGKGFNVGIEGSHMSRTVFAPTTPDRPMSILLTRLLGYTGLFKKKYTLSKIYFTSTTENMATCYI